MIRLPGEVFLKKLFYFFQVIALCKFGHPDISKIILARSFKFGQQIQDGVIILINKLMVGGTVFH